MAGANRTSKQHKHNDTVGGSQSNASPADTKSKGKGGEIGKIANVTQQDEGRTLRIRGIGDGKNDAETAKHWDWRRCTQVNCADAAVFEEGRSLGWRVYTNNVAIGGGVIWWVCGTVGKSPSGFMMWYVYVASPVGITQW